MGSRGGKSGCCQPISSKGPFTLMKVAMPGIEASLSVSCRGVSKSLRIAALNYEKPVIN